MTRNDACPVCSHVQAVVVGRSDHDNRANFNCPRCGRFTIGRMAVNCLPQERRFLAKLSAWIREHDEFGRSAPVILEHNLQTILSSLSGRERVADKQRLLFGAVARRASTLEETIRLTVENDYPLAHAQSGEELRYLLRALGEQGFVRLTETHEWVECEITPKGWSHLDENQPHDGDGLHRTDDGLAKSPIRGDVVDVTRHRFDVALSFPGEYRPYVERVVASLAEALGPNACFYDRSYRAQLAVPNADVLLQEIYRERSDLVVAFVCREYDEKKWCGIEWRKIRERLSEGGAGEIMYVRLDLGDVAGMTTLDGYVDAQEETPETVASLILEKLQVVKLQSEDGLERSGPHGGQAKPDSDGRHAEVAKPESHARLIAGVEALWKSVKVCQDVYSGAMTTLNLLTVGELDDVFHGRRVGNGAMAYMLEEYRDVTFINSRTDRIGEPLAGVEELFVSERLWELYGRIVQIHGRMGFLFHRSFECGSYVDWREDKATLSMLSAFLDDKRLAAATARTIGGMNEVVKWLSREFLSEARNLLRDPRIAHAKPGDSPR